MAKTLTKTMIEGRLAQFSDKLKEKDAFETLAVLAYHDGVIEATLAGTWEGIATMLFEALRMHLQERGVPIRSAFKALENLSAESINAE